MNVLRRSWRLFSDKGGRFLAAAVAYYALLSAAPLFVVILGIVGYLFGKRRAEHALWGTLSTWVAPEGLAAVRGMTERLADTESSGGLLGIALVVYGSTRLFRALHRAINQLWGIDLETVEASRPRMKRYGVRYGGALLFTMLAAALVVALIVVKGGFAMIAHLSVRPPPAVWWAFDATASVALAFILFCALFRYLPETDVTWGEAALSAAVSTFLFAVGSALVTVYVRHKHMSDLYEGATAVVLAVIWAYYSAQVLFFGACVGAVLRQESRLPAHGESTESVQ